MPKCILTVDDDRLITALISKTLQANGYEIMTAHDGEEALEALEEKNTGLDLIGRADA